MTGRIPFTHAGRFQRTTVEIGAVLVRVGLHLGCKCDYGKALAIAEFAEPPFRIKDVFASRFLERLLAQLRIRIDLHRIGQRYHDEAGLMLSCVARHRGDQSFT